MSTERTDTENAILKAAHKVFLRKGTRGALLKDIAQEADVNRALLHYYFRNEDTLSRAAFEQAAADMFPHVQEVLSSNAPIEEKVKTVASTYIDFFRANPYLPGYVIGEVNCSPERVRQMFESVGAPLPLEIVQAQLDERVRTGTLRPISAESFFVNLFSLCVTPFVCRPIIETALDMRDERYEDFIRARKEEIPHFFLNALRPC